MATPRGSGLRAGVSLILTAASALALTCVLAGCASWCRKDSVHAKIPPRNGVNAPDCACTLEYRRNLCVTVNGSDAIPAGMSFVREREDGAMEPLDTIAVAESGHCFGELRGIQRLFLWQGARVVDSTGWFEIPTVDCCHGAAKTVDFKRP